MATIEQSSIRRIEHRRNSESTEWTAAVLNPSDQDIAEMRTDNHLLGWEKFRLVEGATAPKGLGR